LIFFFPETPTMLLNSVKPSSAILLKTIGIKRLKEMTPRKRLLYSVTKMLKKQINVIKRKNASVKQLKIAKTFVTGDSCNHLVDRVSKTTLKFFQSQIKIQNKKAKGRRYSLDDKILALSIFKTSPKGYEFLSSIFALPSISTLNTVLTKIPFTPGINLHIQENLKHQRSKLKSIDKKCVLLFDEMALSPGLKYDKKK